MLFFVAVVGLVALLQHNMCTEEEAILSALVAPYIERSYANQYYARHRRFHNLRSWAMFMNDLSEKQFHHYFRISKDHFQILCRCIEEIVGRHELKSEEYLDKIMSSPHTTPCYNIYFAHANSTGGVITGEVKLASTLRILGGGSYMDMALLFHTCFNRMH